jgi:hypothetical protein
MSRVQTALALPRLLFNILAALKVQRSFLQENILPLVQEAIASGDRSVDEADRKKIKDYYGLAVPAILGEAFCALRGTNMSRRERMASTCQGAMTGLFDDFFDEQDLPEAALEALLEGQHAKEDSSNEKLFLHFYNTALGNCIDPGSMKRRLWQVYEAQVESKKQAGNNHLSKNEIQDITIRKGAYSLLFYRAAFDHALSPAEEAMLYQVGALMQLCNDVFDVYKDQQQGIATLVTTAGNIGTVRSLFLSMLEEAKTLALKSGYPEAAVQQYWRRLSIAVFSRSLVCLDQLEAREKLSGGTFTPADYHRKDLICDMELAVNKWRAVKYYVRYAF